MARVLIFCGLPGTLKTFLACRVAARMGYGYIPSRAGGPLAPALSAQLLEDERMRRYVRVGEIVETLLTLGASVVVDGGFQTSAARGLLLSRTLPGSTILVHCRCSD